RAVIGQSLGSGAGGQVGFFPGLPGVQKRLVLVEQFLDHVAPFPVGGQRSALVGHQAPAGEAVLLAVYVRRQKTPARERRPAQDTHWLALVCAVISTRWRMGRWQWRGRPAECAYTDAHCKSSPSSRNTATPSSTRRSSSMACYRTRRSRSSGSAAACR